VKFFDLYDYYKTNFTLINNFSWRLDELENMLFWEREIYIKLLTDYNEEQRIKKIIFILIYRKWYIIAFWYIRKKIRKLRFGF
jgi:hypothetical protein